MNIVKAVSVIIGTIIGAGFASGKEIYIFFGQYGKFGIIGAIVSATLTGVIIYSTIAITKKFNDYSEKILLKVETIIRKIAHFSIYTIVRSITYVTNFYIQNKRNK